VARRAYAAYNRSPPVGIRAGASRGPHFLIYSFAPGLRVANAFLQSLIGLYDYSEASGDRSARALFVRGEREARRELHLFDTGAWSLYSLGGAESDLNYHRVLRDFMRGLCDRTQSSVWCAGANRFTRYLTDNPKLRYLGPKTARAGRPVAIRMRVSRISCVITGIYRGKKLVALRVYWVPRGRHAFAWTPPGPGKYTVSMLARDYMHHRGLADATLRVTR
jgi:hypothetical protein